MKGHFYAIFGTYCPNSAVSNRMLSYLEVWSQLDIEVTVIFTEPDHNYSRLHSQYSNIKIIYLWDRLTVRSYMLHKMMLFWYVKRFIKVLKPDDRVYLYGQNYILKQIMSHNNRVHLFQERSEHPMVYGAGRWPYRISIKTYLRTCRRIEGSFVTSKPLKEFFVNNGVDASKIHIINMTVNPKRFDGIMKNQDTPKYIAYCGNASNNKDGVDQLIKAFSLISIRYPELYLYIIGRMPNKKEKNNNYQLASELGVSNRVVFTGVVKSEGMPQLLKDSIMLVLDRPDNLQAKHGFPTKLGEYLLTANPIVVTRVGDIPRFVKHGINGMLAEPSNPEDFAAKMTWLLEHPVEASMIGEQGRQLALDSFNSNIEARKIVDVILN